MKNFRISTDINDFDFDTIHRFLSTESYWAKGADMATVRKSFEHSLCFGGFLDEKQVAFCRVITDLATFGYIRDVVVLEGHRGQGYGKALVEAMLARLAHEGVPALMLATADAHGLYEKYGFRPVGDSPKLMAWRRPEPGDK